MVWFVGPTVSEHKSYVYFDTRFCSFATKSDKSLACDTTKKNLLILQYAYSFWLTDDCFGTVFVSRSSFNELDICVFVISLVPIMIILNSFFIEAWMLNSLPNQQGLFHFSLFETWRLWILESSSGGGGGYTSEFLVGVCRPVPHSWLNFRPKYSIFHTRFQTWTLKFIPVFRPERGFFGEAYIWNFLVANQLSRFNRKPNSRR